MVSSLCARAVALVIGLSLTVIAGAAVADEPTLVHQIGLTAGLALIDDSPGLGEVGAQTGGTVGLRYQRRIARGVRVRGVDAALVADVERRRATLEFGGSYLLAPARLGVSMQAVMSRQGGSNAMSLAPGIIVAPFVPGHTPFGNRMDADLRARAVFAITDRGDTADRVELLFTFYWRI